MAVTQTFFLFIFSSLGLHENYPLSYVPYPDRDRHVLSYHLEVKAPLGPVS
jgi:hypothetical protein